MIDRGVKTPDAPSPADGAGESSSGVATDPLLDSLLEGTYLIEARIGQGAMGAVYRARQTAVGRAVAVKVIRPDRAEDEDTRRVLMARFDREIRATSRVNHPHLVGFVSAGELDDGGRYIVLEYLRGRTLGQLRRESGPLASERVAAIGQQIARGLAELHAEGIIHRDLKPENIFCCDFRGNPEFVKIMDFGVARLSDTTIEEEESLTQTGASVGTPLYMAPEQLLGDGVGPETDLYALGIILYELLSGRRPFPRAGGALQSAALRVTRDPRPLRAEHVDPAVREQWEALLGRLLERNPMQRWASAEEVADELGRLARLTEEFETQPGPQLAETEPGARPPQRRLGPKVAVAALLVAGWAVPFALSSADDPATNAPAAVTAAPAQEKTEAPVEPPGEAPEEPPREEAEEAETERMAARSDHEAAEADASVAASPAAAGEPDPGEPAEREPEPPETASEPLQLTLDANVRATVLRDGETLCQTPCTQRIARSELPASLQFERRGYRAVSWTVPADHEGPELSHVAQLRRLPRTRPKPATKTTAEPTKGKEEAPKKRPKVSFTGELGTRGEQ